MKNKIAMTGTFSKHPKFWGFEDDLEVIGVGMKNPNGVMNVQLSDGKEYLDWVCGLGAILLGYGNLRFEEHLVRQVHRGVGFSLPHHLERKVAEKLVHILGNNVPGWVEDNLQVRFAKTGSEATTMAIRLARAVTGKTNIVTFNGHYHGWHDWTVIRTPPAHGIPRGLKWTVWDIGEFGSAPYDEVIKNQSNVAAVIFEYPLVDPPKEWLFGLINFCRERGILIIIDDVVTGLRFGMGGAAAYAGFTPDIVCMGKGLANGYPLSAVISWESIMNWFSRNDPVFCSSTHWGEAMSLAAADSMLDIWDEDAIQHIWHLGQTLKSGLVVAGWNVIGHPPRSLVQFDTISQRAFFINGMRERGILMNRPNFIADSHTMDDVINTLVAAEDIHDEMTSYSPDDLAMLMQPYWPETLFSNR